MSCADMSKGIGKPSRHRGTIHLEDAEIIEQRSFPGNQHVLRVRAPLAAGRAEPGSFAQITCAPGVPLRRPLSIMRTDEHEGWLEFLYKPIGHGLAQLARREPGDRISILAPIGRGFEPHGERRRILAIGGGVGIPPMIFVAQRLRESRDFDLPIVLMGSELPFPFEVAASSLPVPGMPPAASYGMALLEAWGVPSRLASNAGLLGAYGGFVTTLARKWLGTLPAQELADVQLLGCGPHAMLRAMAELARDFDLPCQLALEEFMACGVGGCAGCTVRIETAAGSAMKRVCVDGPVFAAREVFADVFSRAVAAVPGALG